MSGDAEFFAWATIVGLFALIFSIYAFSMTEATKPSEESEKKVKLWLGRILFAIAVVALAIGFGLLLYSWPLRPI